MACERTFASDITADVNNVSVDDMSLEGNSGVGELSATYQSSPQSAWAAAVALKGYVGARQGAAGQVLIQHRASNAIFRNMLDGAFDNGHRLLFVFLIS